MKRMLRCLLTLLPLCAFAVLLVSCPNGSTPPAQDGPADLVPASMTYTGSSVAQGGSLPVTLAIQNLQSGTINKSFGVDFYMATTSTFSPSTDSHVGSATVSGIGGSASTNVNATITIPTGLGSTFNQAVYIYAQVDAAGAITETDKTNNVSTTANAAAVLVYDSTNAGRTYKILLETYAPTGSGTPVDTGMGLWVKSGSTTATSVASANAMGAGPG